jgi:hypothetical protein
LVADLRSGALVDLSRVLNLVGEVELLEEALSNPAAVRGVGNVSLLET